MTPDPRVRIVCDDGLYTSGQVLVDGKPLYAVTAVEYRLGPVPSVGTAVIHLDFVEIDAAALDVQFKRPTWWRRLAWKVRHR